MTTLTLKNSAAARLALASRPEVQLIEAHKAEQRKQLNKATDKARRIRKLENLLRPLDRPAHRQMMAVRRWLHQTYPLCFADFGQPKRPIKIGIYQDVIDRNPQGVNGLRWALRDYASGKSYHRAMVEGAVRVDLDGNPAGVVSAKAALYATKQLARIERNESQLALLRGSKDRAA